ncbi:MAG: hypothetical protein GY757_16515 [bacterium]|nr:hypothetical protein [bacterium]
MKKNKKKRSTAKRAVDSGSPDTLKLPVRLQVFNRSAESLFDGVKMFEVADTSKGAVSLHIDFPKVPDGIYDVFIWVGDPLTGKKDLAVKEIVKKANDV